MVLVVGCGGLGRRERRCLDGVGVGVGVDGR